MKLTASVAFAFAIVLPVTVVLAAPVSLTFTNMSGEVITAITTIPKGEVVETPVNLLQTPIPAGEPLTVTLDLAEGQCVFDVSFTFASGTVNARPDTDLCQTDGIVVE